MALTLFIVFAAVAILGYAVIPNIYNTTIVLAQKREKKLATKMERLLPRSEIKKMSRYLIFAPVALAVALFLLFPGQLKLFGVLFGIVLGFIIPSMYTKYLQKYNQSKFSDQLVDALMIMSSSFRGGLSLVQALEAVVDEMPDPINAEFSTVLGENKMGVSLEEALNHLYNRMPSSAMQQMITSILLARETGGNLPIIFTRIVNNIRETKKIQGQIDTLTMQGKIQGIVMALLPIGFGFVVYSSNRHYLETMLNTDVGRMMLIYAVVSETIGAYMIFRISAIKDV
ncbi:MAG: hypothetical protein A2Z88_06020 [Omnitrophica WOR_2 bacterium GWA2_47_8]|nr:MAG: hypothetical protein A2Z88_06020 [Omnitrophica WOR_2 bacterium GWA2_47_8]